MADERHVGQGRIWVPEATVRDALGMARACIDAQAPRALQVRSPRVLEFLAWFAQREAIAVEQRNDGPRNGERGRGHGVAGLSGTQIDLAMVEAVLRRVMTLVEDRPGCELGVFELVDGTPIGAGLLPVALKAKGRG